MIKKLVYIFIYFLFAVVMHKDKEETTILSHIHHQEYRNRELDAFEHGLLDGDMFLQVGGIVSYYVCRYIFEIHLLIIYKIFKKILK